MSAGLSKTQKRNRRLAVLTVSLAFAATSAHGQQKHLTRLGIDPDNIALSGKVFGSLSFGTERFGVAQTDNGYGNQRGKEDKTVSLQFGSLTNKKTGVIVSSLNAANHFCAGSPQLVYVIDCMSERLEAVARSMPETGDYAEARAALLEASLKLHDLAADNAAADLPRATMQSQGVNGIRTTRPLVAVDPAKLPAAGAQAAQILAELETVLLRSGDASAERKSHYSRIAAAAGSNKVLLRSL